MRARLFSAVLVWPLVSLADADWPSATCTGTLQSCIDAFGGVRIITDGPISEHITFSGSGNLIAAPGYSPRFAAGFGVTNTINTDSFVTIEGLTFEQGSIRIAHTQGVADVAIRHNSILANPANDPGIDLSSGRAGLNAVVEYNFVRQASDGAPTGGINFQSTSGPGAADSYALIYGNTVEAIDFGSTGIMVRNDEDGALEADIIGNTVLGGLAGSIGLSQDNSAANSNVKIISNVVRPIGTEPPSGIFAQATQGAAEVAVYNNTVTGALWGFRDFSNAGVIVGTVQNNIFAYNSVGIAYEDGSFSNDYNLIFGNGSSEPPGPNSILTEPHLIRAEFNERLRPQSPAIDAGNGLVFFGLDLPLVDADGMYRINDITVDMGAFEFGRQHHLHRAADVSTSNFTTLDTPWTNGDPDLELFARSNPGAGENSHALGVFYDGTNHAIFNQNLALIPTSGTYPVFYPGDNAFTFVHENTVADITTTIDQAGMNNEADKIVHVMQNWNASGPGVYNHSHIGVYYALDQWRILNLDFANIPVDADFNVFAQDPSLNAFEHVVSAETIPAGLDTSELNHPTLNGVHCAQPVMTYSVSQSIFANRAHTLSFNMDRDRWQVEDLTGPIEVGTAFFITVDPAQVADCQDLVFRNGLGG